MNSGVGALRGNVVVALVSTKGGVGKTTLSGHIAVEAERHGVGPVALIDMDRQGSLAHWWNAREKSTPFFVESTHSRIGMDLVRLGEMSIGLTIIDTPPAPFHIIEAVAETVAALIIDEFPVSQVFVRVAKPGAFPDRSIDHAAVEITRSRDG